MESAVPLRGLTIIVTRPEENSTYITNQLIENGAKVISLPLIAIEPIQADHQTVTNLQRNSPFSLVIFISKNAVRCGLAIARKHCISAQTVIAAIGPGTASELARHGICSCVTGASPHDSEALLNTQELNSISSESVLIVKGVGGRTTLRDNLCERGAAVQELSCYMRTTPNLENKKLHQISKSDMIMFTSSESARNLLKLLPKNLLNEVLALIPVVGHSRIAHTISQLGFKKRPIIASNPSDAAMLSALIQYARNGDLE